MDILGGSGTSSAAAGFSVAFSGNISDPAAEPRRVGRAARPVDRAGAVGAGGFFAAADFAAGGGGFSTADGADGADGASATGVAAAAAAEIFAR